MKFDQASNAIVSIVGFYADALATMEKVAEAQAQQLKTHVQQAGEQAVKNAEIRAVYAQMSLALGAIQTAVETGSTGEIVAKVKQILEKYGREVDRLAPAVRPAHPGPVPPADV